MSRRPPSERSHKNLHYIAAEKATVTAGTVEREFQLCQIGFAKRDGTIFVSFPYLPRSDGILSVARFPDTQTGQVTLSFGDEAKSTSHLVKFTHHPDGAAHFSQDGKVRSVVRRQSFRLDGPIGHVFQMSAYLPAGFSRFDQTTRRTKRTYLRNLFTDQLPMAVQVRAEWRRKESIIPNIQPLGATSGPVTRVQSRHTGEENVVHFLGQPDSFPLREHVLLVTVNATKSLPTFSSSGVIFLGGYDPHEIQAGDPPVRQTGCLVAIYPASTHDELKRRIESIDYMPPEVK